MSDRIDSGLGYYSSSYDNAGYDWIAWCTNGSWTSCPNCSGVIGRGLSGVKATRQEAIDDWVERHKLKPPLSPDDYAKVIKNAAEWWIPKAKLYLALCAEEGEKLGLDVRGPYVDEHSDEHRYVLDIVETNAEISAIMVEQRIRAEAGNGVAFGVVIADHTGTKLGGVGTIVADKIWGTGPKWIDPRKTTALSSAWYAIQKTTATSVIRCARKV